MSPALARATVEAIVRDVVNERLGTHRAGTTAAPARLSPVAVNVSARHMHVSQEDLERLFGPGATLTPYKALYQPGQFAAAETVTLVGPRSRVIPNLRILGPVRTHSQIELSFTDAHSLGMDDLPLRISGDIANTPGAYLVGPAGFVALKEGVIRAARHVHLTPADAVAFGVKHGDFMRLKVGGDAGLTLERLLVRSDPAAKLEVHLDTDDANACGLHRTKAVELIV